MFFHPTRSNKQFLTTLALFAFVLFPSASTSSAAEFDQFLVGSGKYNCFPPRRTGVCRPSPSALSQSGRTILHVLDQITRRINNKSDEKKLQLILAPVLASRPFSSSLAVESMSDLMRDGVEGFIVGLIRASPDLSPSEKAANERLIIDVFDLKKSTSELKGNLSTLTGFSRKSIKEVSDFGKAVRDARKKANLFLKAFDAANEAWKGANPHAVAKRELLEQGKMYLNACEFAKARANYERARTLALKQCRWDGYTYRTMEYNVSCYEESIAPKVIIPKMGDPSPNYWWVKLTEKKNILAMKRSGVEHRLSLLPTIDEADRILKQNEMSWNKSVQTINARIPVARRALKDGNLKDACAAVRTIWLSEQNVSHLKGCAKKLNDIGDRFRIALNRAENEKSKGISSILKNVKGAIERCKFKGADALLTRARTQISDLWWFDGGGTCRPSSNQGRLRATLIGLENARRGAQRADLRTRNLYRAAQTWNSKGHPFLRQGKMIQARDHYRRALDLLQKAKINNRCERLRPPIDGAIALVKRNIQRTRRGNISISGSGNLVGTWRRPAGDEVTFNSGGTGRMTKNTDYLKRLGFKTGETTFRNMRRVGPGKYKGEVSWRNNRGAQWWAPVTLQISGDTMTGLGTWKRVR